MLSAKWRPFCLSPNELTNSLGGSSWIGVRIIVSYIFTFMSCISDDSMALRRCDFNFIFEIFQYTKVIAILSISCEIILRWMSADSIDDKKALVQLVAWCHQATSQSIDQIGQFIWRLQGQQANEKTSLFRSDLFATGFVELTWMAALLIVRNYFLLQRKLLESRLEEGQLFKEFDQIPRKSPTDNCDVAARPENKDRNRFKDVHPYDKNRVKLAATKPNPTGYINASHVKVSHLQGILSINPSSESQGSIWVWTQPMRDYITL